MHLCFHFVGYPERNVLQSVGVSLELRVSLRSSQLKAPWQQTVNSDDSDPGIELYVTFHALLFQKQVLCIRPVLGLFPLLYHTVLTVLGGIYCVLLFYTWGNLASVCFSWWKPSMGQYFTRGQLLGVVCLLCKGRKPALYQGVSKIWTGYSAFNFLVCLKVIMLPWPFIFLYSVHMYACLGQRSRSIFQCLPQLFSTLPAEPGAQLFG